MQKFSEDDLVERLRELADKETQRAVAKRFGFSAQFINDVLNRRRPMTESLADLLGFVREPVTYILKPGGKGK